MTKPTEKTRRSISKLWVPLVLVIGIGLGLLIAIAPSPYPERFGPDRTPFLEPILEIHVVLSTVSAALLVSLVVIYLKMYVETRANFALGLVIVLITLLLHSVLSHPFFLALAGPLQLGPEAILPSGDLLTIVAYTIFLYLSLE